MKFKFLVAGVQLLCCSLVAGNASAAADVVVNYTLVPQAALNHHLTVSEDGRYIAYRTLLRAAAGGKNAVDIMIRDVVTGSDVQANLMASGDLPIGANCDAPVISGNGRYVAFGCNATVMGVTTKSGTAYFVYDRVTQKTESIPDTGSDSVIISYAPAISKSGQYIAFRTSTGKIFVRDMTARSTVETLVTNGAPTDQPARMAISDDGRYVSFSGRVLSSGYDSLVHDRITGTTEALNAKSNSTANAVVRYPGTSDDGMINVFTSADAALVNPPTSGRQSVFLKNRNTGVTEMISNRPVGVGFVASISGNGRYVAYVAAGEIFVYDRVTKLTRRVVSSSAVVGVYLTMSADGRYVVFNATSGNNRYFGIADMGVAPGVTLSSTYLTLAEGGDPATYSAVLMQRPDTDVNLNVGANSQLSFARDKLTFTSTNWNVPQLVSVRAVQDAVKQGKRTTNIVHTITSSDPDYAATDVANVLVTIDDGVLPTISVPGPTWGLPDMPVTGTAAPGATVILSAFNRTTGWMSGVSTVADAQGKWSYTLTGFTDGQVEIDATADGLKTAVQTVTVKLATTTQPPQPQPTYTDVTGYIRYTAYGLTYVRSTGKYAGDFVITNTGSIKLTGPLHLVLSGLTPGVTLINATGTIAGAPYITVAGSLEPDGSITIPLLVDNPNKVGVGYEAKIYSGKL